jgi:hypothetical protein
MTNMKFFYSPNPVKEDLAPHPEFPIRLESPRFLSSRRIGGASCLALAPLFYNFLQKNC